MASNYDARSEDGQPNRMSLQQGTSMKAQPVEIATPVRFDEEAFARVLNQPGVDDKPIVLVSIMGKRRTGKPSMLNVFLRYLSNKGWENNSWLYDRTPDFGDGFSQIPNNKPGTWLWSKAFMVNSHGREIAVFLMETRNDLWNRMAILSTLLSSVQIYNVKQRIDASDLEKLEFIAQWATTIRKKNKTGNLSQELMFLVRDWGFPERYGLGLRGGNLYLEEENLKEGGRGRWMKKTLDESFNNTSCFLMPHPGTEINQGGMSSHTVAVESMDKDFLCQVESLVETILHPRNLKVKCIDGQEVDARIMVKHAKSCHEALPPTLEMIQWAQNMQISLTEKSRTPATSKSKLQLKRNDRKEESHTTHKDTETQKRSDKQRNVTGSSSLHGEPLRSTANLSRPEAVRILRVDDDRVHFDDEAFSRVLGQPGIQGKPIVVVSIAGALRSGKSFMLNFFLRYLRNEGWENNTWMGEMESKLVDGFSWRPGLDPDTHGITIWSEIFVVKSNDREVAVLLIDTQGLYDRAISKTVSTQIFVLSTLLSSVQIFNVSQLIQESDLQAIEFFAEYAREATGIDDKRRLCQKLMFLVRNWQDVSNMDFGLEGGTKYLKYRLEVAREETSSQLLQVRENIQNSFDSIGCFLMPFPGMKVAGCRRGALYDGLLKEIDEEFIEQLPPLIESILHPNNMTVKRIEGQEVDARTMVNFAKSCSDSFASGQLPEVKTLVEATEDFLNVEAYQTCIKEYDEKMQQVLKSAGDQTDEEYRKEHHQTKLRVLAQFDDQTGFGSQTKMKAKREELESALEQAFANLLLPRQEPNKGHPWTRLSMKELLYKIADEIKGSEWPRFARTKLELSEREIDNIQTDNRPSVEEEKIQMLILWTKKKRKETKQKQKELLISLVEDFYAP